MVVFGLVVRVGVGDEVSGAAGSERGPQHARVECRAAVQRVGARRLAGAALASSAGSEQNRYK